LLCSSETSDSIISEDGLMVMIDAYLSTIWW